MWRLFLYFPSACPSAVCCGTSQGSHFSLPIACPYIPSETLLDAKVLEYVPMGLKPQEAWNGARSATGVRLPVKLVYGNNACKALTGCGWTLIIWSLHCGSWDIFRENSQFYMTRSINGVTFCASYQVKSMWYFWYCSINLWVIAVIDSGFSQIRTLCFLQVPKDCHTLPPDWTTATCNMLR